MRGHCENSSLNYCQPLRATKCGSCGKEKRQKRSNATHTADLHSMLSKGLARKKTINQKASRMLLHELARLPVILATDSAFSLLRLGKPNHLSPFHIGHHMRRDRSASSNLKVHALCKWGNKLVCHRCCSRSSCSPCM